VDSLDLSTATVALFAPYVGSAFTLEEGGALTLGEATALPYPPHREGLRQPFRLTFTGKAPMLAQGIWRLTHATLGVAEIFLVPIAGDGTTFTYEAIFN
jgi:hypothetical protein